MQEGLDLAAGVLSPKGIIYVAENEFDGFFGGNASCRLIFAVTSIRHPLWIALAKRYFNTAGVGVCFQSRAGWLRSFDRFDFDTVDYFRHDRWQPPMKKRLAFHALGLKGQWSGHYVLRPRAVRPSSVAG